METYIILVTLWGGISIIWILYLYNTISTKREEFYNYFAYHQKFIGLYVELSLRNRKLIEQNKNYKHAIADSLFYPKSFDLNQCVEWYKKYSIDPKDVNEDESSISEVTHFLKVDQNVIRQSKTILS